MHTISLLLKIIGIKPSATVGAENRNTHITGLCGPAAFTAHNVLRGILLRAAFSAELAGVKGAAEALPAGGCRRCRYRLGCATTLTELASVLTAAGITFPCSCRLGLRHGVYRNTEPVLSLPQCLVHLLTNPCFIWVLLGEHRQSKESVRHNRPDLQPSAFRQKQHSGRCWPSDGDGLSHQSR